MSLLLPFVRSQQYGHWATARHHRRGHQLFRVSAAIVATLAVGRVAVAQQSSSWLGGWLQVQPSPQRIEADLQRQDPKLVQTMASDVAALQKNPNNAAALSELGAVCLAFQEQKNPTSLWTVWQEVSAKALEKAVQLNPKDWIAWHNYGQLNFEAGDLWALRDHSNARRAVWAFDHAIALNPQSARSFMGRGWAYLEMDDAAHANADFQTTLRLDPTRRADIDKEIGIIRGQKAQEARARGTVGQIGAIGSFWHDLDMRAKDSDPGACARVQGTWSGSSCMGAR
jgi:tetratricopeptide (TPR) repeat protein